MRYRHSQGTKLGLLPPVGLAKDLHCLVRILHVGINPAVLYSWRTHKRNYTIFMLFYSNTSWVKLYEGVYFAFL